MAKIVHLTKKQVKAGVSIKSSKPASFKWKIYSKLLLLMIIIQNGYLAYHNKSNIEGYIKWMMNYLNSL